MPREINVWKSFAGACYKRCPREGRGEAMDGSAQKTIAVVAG
eukprot:CAMPEP_0174913282 /NCGR_PEP_ID=MMETSP0167-20121228/80240_1 /TAXON_ID=38298 /ORGANISM="Rhodella maculata, Strain CCMP736" /LENGTH=41 /DNA_ID= /DNA_START= /DNA_END= /DNA_ORIENTATION=